MAIQVSSTVHAAATMFVVRNEHNAPKQFLQSPQGCILQRIEDQGANGYLVLLDYPLDVGSTGLACQVFWSQDPPTQRDFAPATCVLFHIDDRVKLIAAVAFLDGKYKTVDVSFHAVFFNYQANQQELYPIELVNMPPVPPPIPVI